MKSDTLFTYKVFKVIEVHKTKPHMYLLENLNGKEIKGLFYSYYYNSALVIVNLY